MVHEFRAGVIGELSAWQKRGQGGSKLSDRFRQAFGEILVETRSRILDPLSGTSVNGFMGVRRQTFGDKERLTIGKSASCSSGL